MSSAPGEDFDRIHLFTIADQDYFLGLAGLVNSLRLHGCDAPLTVLDLGLTPSQRELFGAQCEFLSSRELEGLHPWLLPPFACTLRPADIVLYGDADVIVRQ